MKPIYQDRGGFEDQQTCRNTLVSSYSSTTPHMISHHITDVMIGRTLFMLSSTHAVNKSHSMGRDGELRPTHPNIPPPPHLDSSACCDKKAADRQRTQTRWQNHTADGRRVDWVGLEVVICFVFWGLFFSWSGQFPSRRETAMTSQSSSSSSSCENIWDIPARFVDGAWPEWS